MNQPDETPTLDGTLPRKGLGNPGHLDSYPNQAVEAIFERRSIRRFKPDPMDPAQLDLIADAGLRAPMTDAFYGAPVSASIFTPETWEVGPLDAALAAENMILAAWSMGVGACRIDRSRLVFAADYGMDLRRRASIPGDYAPQLQVVLGYPESTARDHRAPYPNRASWI